MLVPSLNDVFVNAVYYERLFVDVDDGRDRKFGEG